MTIEQAAQDPRMTLVDVREPLEFMFGHAKGAQNIPLGSIGKRIAEIKDFPGPVIAYCRSGNRSGQAVQFIQSQGLKQIFNGGSLANVRSLLAKHNG